MIGGCVTGSGAWPNQGGLPWGRDNFLSSEETKWVQGGEPSRKWYQLGGWREAGGEGGSVGCGGGRGPARQDVVDQGGFWPLS